MANRERGEVEIVLDGVPKTLRLTMNAVCALEARTGQTFGELIERIQRGSIVALRDFVSMLLQPYHSAEFPTVERVGDFIDAVGVALCGEKVRELLELQPQTTAENPHTAGTGADSLLRAVG
jgi:Phage tail tube protein, GTA-gp10